MMRRMLGGRRRAARAGPAAKAAVEAKKLRRETRSGRLIAANIIGRAAQAEAAAGGLFPAYVG
jgi:hypothetical protein